MALLDKQRLFIRWYSTINILNSIVLYSLSHQQSVCENRIIWCIPLLPSSFVHGARTGDLLKQMLFRTSNKLSSLSHHYKTWQSGTYRGIIVGWLKAKITSFFYEWRLCCYFLKLRGIGTRQTSFCPKKGIYVIRLYFIKILYLFHLYNLLLYIFKQFRTFLLVLSRESHCLWDLWLVPLHNYDWLRFRTWNNKLCGGKPVSSKTQLDSWWLMFVVTQSIDL